MSLSHTWDVATCQENKPVHAHPHYNFKIHLIFTLAFTPTFSNLSVYLRSPQQYLYGISHSHKFHKLRPLILLDLFSLINFIIITDHETSLYANPQVTCLILTPVSSKFNSEDTLSILLRQNERRISTHIQSDEQNYFSLYFNLYISK
jgi:hypothetical protein